ncbi:MAG: T9SS type A sorting domain-containing protein [Flavobacteriales bacterium]|nr:T9SS type A sorting domain-containing protein [Flavobacteriales bacterium]
MKFLFSPVALLLPVILNGQVLLRYDQSVPVTNNGALSMAWAGGLNTPQVSDIDLDGDGDKDIFLFDRAGNKVVTLLNQGIAGENSYTFTNDYATTYPFRELTEWVLLRDYNGDGKEDIFGQTLGGMAVWKNTSVGNTLSFVQVDTLVRSNYVPTDANMYITQVDIPGIEDIDSDGDLDVLTFSIFGNYLEYHKNMSMELYGTADSLEFEVRNRCWGYFSENLNNNTVTLNNPCQFNLPNPELPILIGNATEAAIAKRYQPEEGITRSAAHVGSTLLPIDLDGDNDKDLLIGDVAARTLLALTNGGTLDSAYMVSQDSLFPIYDETCVMNVFPAPFYEDVDNDGRRDLIVAPNYPSLSENKESLWFYKNTNTDASPIFNYQQADLFQEHMLDFGEGAYPVPFDFDGDGLMDLIVANYGYYDESAVYPCKMAALRNIGTPTSPAFDLVNEDYMNLSTSGIGNAMYPAFGDIDGDGDKDLYIGDLNGKLHYFRNDPLGPVAQFSLIQPNVPNDLVVPIDVGQFASPQFFDVDADGLLDMLIGERNGNINYYNNAGSAGTPTWHLENDSIGNIDVAEWWNVTGYSVPFMYLNGSGERELIVGSESGWIHWFDGIDGNLEGTWNLLDSTWQDIREGNRTAVTMHDYDDDGYMDAVIGNYRGGISFWRNDFAARLEDHSTFTSADVFSLMPNPAAEKTSILLNIPVAKNMHVDVLNGTGQVVFSARIQDKQFMLDTHAFGQGVFMVQVTAGAQHWVQRLVVLH